MLNKGKHACFEIRKFLDKLSFQISVSSALASHLPAAFPIVFCLPCVPDTMRFKECPGDGRRPCIVNLLLKSSSPNLPLNQAVVVIKHVQLSEVLQKNLYNSH
jgi:hypothetical protein